MWTDFTNRPGKLPSRCFLKHIIPLEPGTLEGKASFSSRLKTRGTYDARVTEFQTPGRLSARTRLPPRFSRLSSFVSVLPSSSLRDNKVTSRVYGEIEVFPHSPPRYCRLQLFNRATSMALDDTSTSSKGCEGSAVIRKLHAVSCYLVTSLDGFLSLLSSLNYGTNSKGTQTVVCE